jgi:hypothetical protein
MLMTRSMGFIGHRFDRVARENVCGEYGLLETFDHPPQPSATPGSGPDADPCACDGSDPDKKPAPVAHRCTPRRVPRLILRCGRRSVKSRKS